ncbi:copper chaperone PCu(A)C [Kocuria tytonis]|uniref:Copper chaperone PCu(A)C n=1 Tax=Kocuria tytonis TaxID=2054280 RepID=A0A495A5A4_9MICC|nr:copper chaperone PCu(A)C [Kocuria tytonis]RKQ34860.1 copper chaperone PCu(A)C [Kocuria tytonis]
MNNHSHTTDRTAPHTTEPRSLPRAVRPAHRALAAVAALGLGMAALTGCSSQNGEQAASNGGESSASQTAAAAPLELGDGWAKAADSGMTAVFGKVTNTSDKDVTLTGAAADGTADSVQLHETAKDGQSGSTRMKEKKGGFTIPAGQSITLEPGGNHIMLMGLTCSLQPGSDLTLRLSTDAGAQDVTVPVRDYSGAKENYAPGDGASGSSDEHSSHGSHEHGEHSSHEGMDMSSSAPAHEHASHGGHADSPSASALPECHGR